MERGPLSLASTIEELFERKSNRSGLEGRRDPSRWPLGIFYKQKLTLTSSLSGGRSVGIVRSRTQATDFLFFFFLRPKPKRMKSKNKEILNSEEKDISDCDNYNRWSGGDKENFFLIENCLIWRFWVTGEVTKLRV
jgi:hypothetical protein